eukprot:m.104342 g.104342  ORF g.104342 m.104342 type:complete len:51 (+) comp13258_c0_seq4:682-834(+)
MCLLLLCVWLRMNGEMQQVLRSLPLILLPSVATRPGALEASRTKFVHSPE